jgi:hypothetical protein
MVVVVMPAMMVMMMVVVMRLSDGRHADGECRYARRNQSSTAQRLNEVEHSLSTPGDCGATPRMG